MTVMLLQVDWTGNDQQGVSNSFSFDDIESVNIKKDSQAKSSYATIVLKNVSDRFITGYNQPFAKYVSDTNDIIFKEGDTVKIYAAEITSFRALDTTTTSSDLLMTGEIAEVNIKGENDSAKVTLKIVDKTYIILNRLHTYAYITSAGLTAPDIIKIIVDKVTNDVDSDTVSFDYNGDPVSNGVYGVDARLESDGGFIEDTRQDDSSFPTLAMAKVAKPAYDWIKGLSTIDSTNDFTGTDDENAPTQNRNMLFYIDELNRFHWFYPRDTVSTTLDEALDISETSIDLVSVDGLGDQGTVFIGSERIDYTGITTNTLTGCTRGANNTDAAIHSNGDTVRNAISIIAGDTTSGYTMQSYNITKKTLDIVNFVIFNCGADMIGNGISSYFFDRATKSKSLKDTNKSYNDISSKLMQEEINSGRLTEDNTTSSTFTYKGNRYKETTGDYDTGSGITTDWGSTVTSDSAYNASFRTECIRQGKISAQLLTAGKGSARWAGSMMFKFHRFTAGEVIEFTSTQAGVNQQSFRIKSVQYNLTKSGGNITLNVEEDERKLGEV